MVKNTLLCLLLLTVPCSIHGQTAAPQQSLETRIAAQNALFEEQFEQTLRDSPLFATSIGDYRYNDQLSSESAAQHAKENTQNKA